MTREELLQYLVQMGFDRNRAAGIIETLLKQLTVRDTSIDQALKIIAADIQTGGKISKQLNEIKQGISANAGPSPAQQTCPMCGHPRSPEVPGLSKPGECSHCGVIFGKIKSGENATKPAQSQTTAETNSPPAQSSGRRNFIARYKWIIAAAVAVVIAANIAFPFIQAKRKQQYAERLATFDQQLTMDTREEFEVSLDNMKLVIDVGAIMVAQRRWSESDISWFCQEARNRVNRFVEMMDEKAAGENKLFDFRIAEVKEDLCSGMHMLFSVIRDEDIRGKWLLFSAAVYSPDFNASDPLGEGLYIACDISRYRGSSQWKLVRDGKEYVLRERTEKEKAAWKNKQQVPFPPQKPARTQAEIEADEAFKRVSTELSLMQYSYRRKHQTWCGDLNELVSDHLSIQRAEVTPETMDLINSGSIAIEITNDGKSYSIKDLRGEQAK